MRLETERLILRPLEEADRRPYVEMNADPAVTRFFPNAWTKEDSSAAFDGFLSHQAQYGYCFDAVIARADERFIGVIGLTQLFPAIRDALPGHPEVEIGWLLTPSAWGQGLATEGASACLAYAWSHLGLDEVIAITSDPNLAARRVMEKIGMAHDSRCDHRYPNAPADHPNSRRLVYRIGAPSTPDAPR